MLTAGTVYMPRGQLLTPPTTMPSVGLPTPGAKVPIRVWLKVLPEVGSCATTRLLTRAGRSSTGALAGL